MINSLLRSFGARTHNIAVVLESSALTDLATHTVEANHVYQSPSYKQEPIQVCIAYITEWQKYECSLFSNT